MTILPRRRRRRWLPVATMLVIMMASGLWWVSAPFRVGAAPATPSPSVALGIHKVAPADWHPDRAGLIFILVLGSDARNGPPNAGGGCDSIHIVAINPQQKAGTILDFPRDSYLSGRKFTDSCRTQGFDGAAQILESHTGIKVQFIVRTEFSHFMAFINDLGGIDVEIKFPMHDQFSGTNFDPGVRHLSGGEALAFCRQRHGTPAGDFTRTENQGRFILAGLAKFRSEMADPHRFFQYLYVAQHQTSFNVPLGDLIRLAFIAKDIDPGRIANVVVPGSTGTAGTASIVNLNPGDTYSRVKDDAIY